jgi:hypothetical protein
MEGGIGQGRHCVKSSIRDLVVRDRPSPGLYLN